MLNSLESLFLSATGEDQSVRRQYAALPYRWVDGPQIMLLSSRETRRWVLPKGWPMTGRSGSRTAAIEAIEEAGLLGEIDETPFGSYRYMKKLRQGRTQCVVFVYPMRVDRQRQSWPERGMRDTIWFDGDMAADLVAEPDLRELLRDFVRCLRTQDEVRRAHGEEVPALFTDV